MDQGWCAAALAFRLREGTSDGMNLGGRTVVLGFDFPGPTLFDGNGTARIYIDGGASAEQQRELDSIFHGQKGGPMGAIAPLVANWLTTQTANIEVRDEGDSITVSVGNAGQVESRLLRDPEGHGFELRGGGFIGGFGMQAGELAPSSSRWSDPDLRRFETKSGLRGDFTWNG